MPSSYWRRGSMRKSWIRRLSGRILKHSMAEAGVRLWMELLEDSLVSRSVSLGNKKDPPMSDGSGPISLESFAMWNPDSCSWKTSQACLLEGWETYSKTWPTAGTMRNGECFRRLRSALHISESESSSWLTPDVPLGGRTLSARAVDAKGQTDKGKRQVGLNNQAKHWPTARANDWKDSDQPRSRRGLMPDQHLPAAAKHWPTPTASDYGHNRGGSMGRVGPERPSLSTLVGKTWPTPIQSDSKRSGSRNQAGSRAHKGISLTDAITSTSSHQARTIPNDGSESSVKRRSLNPQFVEWLMGLPIGWTNSESLETQSFPSWRRLHIEHLRELLRERLRS